VTNVSLEKQEEDEAAADTAHRGATETAK